jgi:hypothetical protein
MQSFAAAKLPSLPAAVNRQVLKLAYGLAVASVAPDVPGAHAATCQRRQFGDGFLQTFAGAERHARPTLHVSLARDHRILHGADGARFLDRVAQLLTSPLARLV